MKQLVLKWFSWEKHGTRNRFASTVCNFSFFLSAIIILSGCAQTLSAGAFSQIPQGKFLANYSAFDSVSGFNTNKLQNRYDEEWKAKTSGAEALLELLPEDSIQNFGGSLAILYEISQHGSITVSSKLKELDVSQATFLVAKVNTEDWGKFQGKLIVHLKDVWGNQKAVQVRPTLLHPGATQEWTDLEISTMLFKGINFDALSEISFELKAVGAPISGSLKIDEVAFFGPQNLVFESGKDNLKSFPAEAANDDKRIAGIKDQKEFLREIAKDTWKYFDSILDKDTNLALDHIRSGREKSVGAYTSPTNIAFQWLAYIGAADLGFIKHEDAQKRIQASIETLKKLELWEGRYYYNFYRTVTLKPSSYFVSSIDNAWLVGALVIVRQAYPGKFDDFVAKTLSDINFKEFYDEANGQIRLGFDENNATFTSSHYGLVISEARLMSYLAIGKGDLPKEHWAKVFRTLPKEWDWQTQVPQGHQREIFGIPVFQGYYRYKERKFVPSWGGSLFEFLAPSLLVNEQSTGNASVGLNNQIATELHIQYALRDKQYPIWGIAPAAVPDGKHWRYKEFGVKEFGAKGYRDEAVIAPYASSLAIEMKPTEVVQNFRTMLNKYPDSYGPFGFYDAIDVRRGRVNHQYLALDQGMMFVAITNYLTDGSFRKRFHADEVGKAVEELLKSERFFV